MNEYKIEIMLPDRDKRILQYFVFVAFFLPAVDMSGYSTIFNGIVSNPLGYKFLSLLLSLPFLRRWGNFYTNIKTVINSVAVATLFQILIFILTIFSVGFYDALTVYRQAFCQCLHLFILLPFILQLNVQSLDYVINLCIKYIIVLSVIYILDNLFFHTLSVLALGKVLSESRGGVSIDRSIIGFPPIIGGWIFLFFADALKGNRKSLYLFLLSIFATFISYTRSMMLEAVIGCSIIGIIVLFKHSKYFGKIVKMLMVFVIAFLVLSIVFPQSIGFWSAKLEETFGTELKDDEGTYAFRERLIEQAQDGIADSPIIGLGYIRDSDKGEYSFVLGSDTYIAPILWAEGYLGLLLRICPWVLLFFISFKRISRNSDISAIDLMILALIISSSVGYVQTRILTCYPLTLMIVILFKQKQYYNEELEDFGNNSFL